MGAHSTIVGGSSAGRVHMCPASVKLSENIPQAPASIYAQEGTALHTVMEMTLTEPEKWEDTARPYVPSEEFIGMTIEGVEITSELYVDKLVPAGTALADLFKRYDIGEFEAECVVNSPSIKGAFGTCDVVATTKTGEVVIADFKFGDGVIVDAKDNTQLMFYTAVALEDPDLEDWLGHVKPTDNVIMAIIQPARNNPLDVWETQVKRPVSFLAELLISVSSLKKAHLSPNSGEWCKWCPAASVCPAKRAEAQEMITLDTETSEGLAEALLLADKVEPWLRKLRKHAHEVMDQGGEIPGFKLVRTEARRTWVDPVGAQKKLARAKKLRRGDYLKETLVTPPQLEKICKQKDVDFDVFSDYYDSVSKGTAVVPESNPRQAITSKAGKVDLTATQTETEKE